jgi:hypothetical protein
MHTHTPHPQQVFFEESDLDHVAKLVVRSNVLGKRRTKHRSFNGPTQFDCKLVDQLANLLGTGRENVLWARGPGCVYSCGQLGLVGCENILLASVQVSQ